MSRNPSKKDYCGDLPVGFDRFIVIEEPRVGGNEKHHFGEIPFIAVSALVCGVSLFSGMVECAAFFALPRISP